MKTLLSSIPLSRQVIYLLILCSLPLIWVPYDYLEKKNKLESIETQLEEVFLSALKKEKSQALNLYVQKHYEGADQNFLSKLEGLTFLNKEKAAIEEILKKTHLPASFSTEERLLFLQGDKNKIHFSEKTSDSKEGVFESIASFAHPVQVDSSDLRTILQLIEESQISQPQLMITDFKITRKALEGNECYDLNIELLKRYY